MKRFIKSCVRAQVYYNSVPLIRYQDKAGRGAEWGVGEGVVLPIIAHSERLRLKGVAFSSLR